MAIKGDPKTGKTHLALTGPAPIALFSFDRGTKRVLPKFKDKEIELFTYDIPLLETSGKNKTFALKIWNKFIDDYHYVCQSETFRTVIIDTATMLYEICRFAFREETGQGNIIKVQYEEVYARMSGVLMAQQYYDFNLISTYHLKDEYKGGESTGNQALDGYKRTEGLVDVVLETRVGRNVTAKGSENSVIATITDCGFDLRLNGTELTNPTFDDIAAVMFGG